MSSIVFFLFLVRLWYEDVSLVFFSPTKQGKGTESFGKRNKTRTFCVRCSPRSFHLQKSCCASCGSPLQAYQKANYFEFLLYPRLYVSCLLVLDVLALMLVNIDNWSMKTIERNTTGTGRMRYLRHVYVRFKSGFREGALFKFDS